MGEIADMILDGILDEETGEWLGEAVGYPRRASDMKHIDGEWHTTGYDYKGYRILIKSRKGGGMKAHAFDVFPNSDKVLFTLRYGFIKPEKLLSKVKSKIDLIIKSQPNG